MERTRKEDDAMDVDQPEDKLPPSSSFRSPSYSPLTPPEIIETEQRVKSGHDKAEEEEKDPGRAARRYTEAKAETSSSEEKDEDEEVIAARRKAKGKGRATSPEEEDNDKEDDEKEDDDEEDDDEKDDDEEDGDEEDDNHHRSKISIAALLNPLASHPTERKESIMDMDNYRAGDGTKTKFGEADAIMNETLPLPKPASPSDQLNQCKATNTPSAAHNPLTEHRDLAPFNMSRLIGKLALWQQTQQSSAGRGRGRGRGRGQGWGLEWQETETQETMRLADVEPANRYEDPVPSPEEEDEVEDEEEGGWEAYDPAVWEMAEERTQSDEGGKVTLKMPPTEAGSSSRGERSSRPATTGNEKMELVRAVKSYKAILTELYLSYEKGDLMKVLHRDSDGLLILACPGTDPQRGTY